MRIDLMQWNNPQKRKLFVYSGPGVMILGILMDVIVNTRNNPFLQQVV